MFQLFISHTKHRCKDVALAYIPMDIIYVEGKIDVILMNMQQTTAQSGTGRPFDTFENPTASMFSESHLPYTCN